MLRRGTGNEEPTIHVNSLRDSRSTRPNTPEVHLPSGCPYHSVSVGLCVFRSFFICVSVHARHHTYERYWRDMFDRHFDVRL